MHIPRVVTEAEYRAALAEIARLVEREPDRRGTPEGERLDALSLVAEAYESGRHLADLGDAERR
jgi:antitoxin component HigA of HigAB toxin-antitoxin module